MRRHELLFPYSSSTFPSLFLVSSLLLLWGLFPPPPLVLLPTKRPPRKRDPQNTRVKAFFQQLMTGLTSVSLFCPTSACIRAKGGVVLADSPSPGSLPDSTGAPEFIPDKLASCKSALCYLEKTGEGVFMNHPEEESNGSRSDES